MRHRERMDEIPPEVPGYRLTRLLGAGSTSTVWRARRDADDALVAIKVLPGAADEEAVREYSLLQHAAHEHVVGLHETLALDGPEGPSTALVLEHLAGGSLGGIISARGHLSPGEAVTVIAPVAEALAALHDLGIVHGDISPGNVLFDSTGRPALADLGFSRLSGEPPGEVHGTDGYLAPELLEGGEPDRAGDVHALGALAWLCLVGAPPGHVAERDGLAELVPAAPALTAAVEASLCTDPAARPEAHELARAVFDALPAQPLRLVSTGDVASGLTRRIREAATTDVPDWQRELAAAAAGGEPPRRRWWQPARRPAPGKAPPGRARGRPPGRHAAPRRSRRVPEERATARAHDTARVLAAAATGRPRSGRAVALALAAGLLLALLVPWQHIASAGGDEPQARTETAATSGESHRTRRSAPREDPAGLVRELTSLRQKVVTELDTSALGRLVEPGSPAAEHDTRLLETLRSEGQRYEGVELSVPSAQLERTSGRTAVIRARTDESDYVVVDRGGRREQHPARRGRQVELVLVWHDETWRVREVRPA